MIYRPLLEEVESIISQRQYSDQEIGFDDSAQLVGLSCDGLISDIPAVTISGWPNFNQCFGGFRSNEFSVLCGTSGTGKTTFLANLSAHLLLQNVPHFVASVETGPHDYVLRTISALSAKDYNSGDKFSKEEIEMLIKRMSPIFKRGLLKVSQYISKIDPKRILCDLLYARKEYGCKIALLDNLNFFMPFVDFEKSNSALDKTIHDFVMFCKNIDMHIVMVMHPRKKEDADGCARVDSEYDIKGSSTIIQESHNVILLNKPTKKQAENGYSQESHREITFAKLRRRGAYTGKRIMFENVESKYFERSFV